MVDNESFILLNPIIAYDDIIKWKHFSRYWPFVKVTGGFQWRGAWVFSLICAWTNCWVNTGDAGDWRRHRGHSKIITTIKNKLLLVLWLLGPIKQKHGQNLIEFRLTCRKAIRVIAWIHPDVLRCRYFLCGLVSTKVIQKHVVYHSPVWVSIDYGMALCFHGYWTSGVIKKRF